VSEWNEGCERRRLHVDLEARIVADRRDEIDHRALDRIGLDVEERERHAVGVEPTL
jgi:hypothetical protein